MPTIVQKGHPVLREKAREVVATEFGSDKLKNILADMKAALDAEPDGAALAAPQIGLPLRIFIISERVFSHHPDTEKEPKKQHLIYINPVLVRRAREKQLMEEGCLSVRGKYGKIARSVRATVRAYDEHGKPFTRGASGLLAQAFQHECDHLDGTLFIDNAADVWDVPHEHDGGA